jgi:oleate hydratase
VHTYTFSKQEGHHPEPVQGQQSSTAHFARGVRSEWRDKLELRMKAHLIGGGIASLAAAAYLFKDGNFLASNIHIYETSDVLGGALDAGGDPVHGYSMRGGRMFEEHDPCMHELLSFVPSRSDPSESVDEELRDFYRNHSWFNTARLMGESGHIIDFSKLGLSTRNLQDLSHLLLTPESRLDGNRQ